MIKVVRSVSRPPFPPLNFFQLVFARALSWLWAVYITMPVGLGHRRSWKISVHAKISSLYVKLRATVKYPSGKFQGLLKLDRSLTRVNSKSESRILVRQRATLKSRILSFVKKHSGRRRSKKAHGFEMPNVPKLFAAEIQSWHLGRVETSCVAAFGVGLRYLVGVLGPVVKKSVGINPSLSWFVLVCVVLWAHRCKFLRAMLIVIAAFAVILLQIDRFPKYLEAHLHLYLTRICSSATLFLRNI